MKNDDNNRSQEAQGLNSATVVPNKEDDSGASADRFGDSTSPSMDGHFSTNPIREILRLQYEHEMGQRGIGKCIQMSKSWVGKVQKSLKDKGITYEISRSMTDEDLEEIVHPSEHGKGAPQKDPDVDWEHFYKLIMAPNSKANRAYVWSTEYRAQNPEGLSYSQFCAKLRTWSQLAGKDLVMPIERDPGKEMFIDWVGDPCEQLIDMSTGEIITTYLFVTTLGDGGMPFAEAFTSMQQSSWMQGHFDAFRWYGGIPRVLIPDNTKTAVIHRQMYDTTLNHAYLQLAYHYRVAICPARVRKPRDKPGVEETVGWLETWLMEWLKTQVFFSLEEMNAAIQERMKFLAQQPYENRPGTRQQVFDTWDKPALRPLPKEEMEFFETRMVTRFPNNYHVEVRETDKTRFYYSIPYTAYPGSGYIHLYPKKVEIFSYTGEKLAIHQRRFSGRRYVTNLDHMPRNHQEIYKQNRYDGHFYRGRARSLGPNVYLFVDTLLKDVPAEEQAYKSCMGVLTLADKHGEKLLDAACRKALALRSVTYTTVKTLLKQPGLLNDDEKSTGKGNRGRNDNTPRKPEAPSPSDSDTYRNHDRLNEDHENLRDPDEWE